MADFYITTTWGNDMTYLGTQIYANMRCTYANLASKACPDRDELIRTFFKMAEELKKDNPKEKWEKEEVLKHEGSNV